MSARLTVLENIEKVAAEQDQTLAPLTNDLILLESGLDSLCFAILVARLESELGVDPFTAEEEIRFPVTLGDFIRLYEDATAHAAA